MSASGILTCIGFPGWCPLQLLVPPPADPAAFAGRLRQALASGGDAPPAALLPALLRSQRDLVPLGAWNRFPACPPGGSLHFHYRLVCRPGSPMPLRITAWERRESGEPWSLIWRGRPLGAFLCTAATLPGASISA